MVENVLPLPNSKKVQKMWIIQEVVLEQLGNHLAKILSGIHSSHKAQTQQDEFQNYLSLNGVKSKLQKVLEENLDILGDNPESIKGRRQWHPTPVLLPGKSMDRGAW